MSGHKAIRALKEANASQSRLIEKLTSRNEALEGVVEAVKRWDIKYVSNLYKYLSGKGKANSASWVSGILEALKRLEEV